MEAIWEFIQGYLTIGNLIALIAIILGLVAANTGLNFLNEIKEIIQTYRDAVHPDSPGGKKITEEERRGIEKEVAEAVSAVWDKYKSTIFGFLGRVVGKLKFWK